MHQKRAQLLASLAITAGAAALSARASISSDSALIDSGVSSRIHNYIGLYLTDRAPSALGLSKVKPAMIESCQIFDLPQARR
jgi:precorrin isomerase